MVRVSQRRKGNDEKDSNQPATKDIGFASIALNWKGIGEECQKVLER